MVNRCVTTALRPLAPLFSQDTLLHVPVVGVVEVRPPENLASAVLMHNDGHDRIASMLYWRGLDGWEPATIRTFLRLISPGSAVLDVGANSGLFALLAGRRDPSVEVHAVEPVSRVFSLLGSNVALNGLENVTCHRLACSDREGAAVLRVPAGEPVPVMASLLAGWCEGPSTDEAVDCVTVDAMVATYDLPRVEVIKIDAEGSEDAVLRGARVTLDRHRPSSSPRSSGGEAWGNRSLPSWTTAGTASSRSGRGGLVRCRVPLAAPTTTRTTTTSSPTAAGSTRPFACWPDPFGGFGRHPAW